METLATAEGGSEGVLGVRMKVFPERDGNQSGDILCTTQPLRRPNEGLP